MPEPIEPKSDIESQQGEINKMSELEKPDMDQHAQQVVGEPSSPEIQKPILRFRVPDRLEHWVFITSFLILGLTGLVQRYATNAISEFIVSVFNGIENTRQIHHIAAIAMMFSVIYHIGAVIYKLYVRRVRMTMLPASTDFLAAWDTIKYFLGIKRHPAQQGRYTFEEKVEYWAVVWGTVVMGLTGFIMWNPILVNKFLPGEFIPASKFAHSMEAVLAVLSIFIWHFYHIFIKTFNKSMFTGKLNQEQMLEEHPMELADIKAGTASRPVDPIQKAKRRKIFIPTYSVMAVVMFIGVYFFVNYEETAISTSPPKPSDVEVFVPLTATPLPTLPPTNTPDPLAEAPTWENTIGPLLNDRCSACHGAIATLGGLDFSSYSSAIAGGNNGPVIIPGDPANSKLVLIQETGGHPGQLSQLEIEMMSQWIETGAPEK